MPVVATEDEPEAEAEEITTTLLGLTFSALTDELRAELRVEADVEGLAVTAVDEASEAAEKGLRVGDIITEAGLKKVTSIADLTKSLDEVKEAGRKSMLLLVLRAGDPSFVALGLEE